MLAPGAVSEPFALTSETPHWFIIFVMRVPARSLPRYSPASTIRCVKLPTAWPPAVDHRGAGVARRAEPGPAEAVVVPVRGDAALELALRDGDAVAVAVVQDRRADVAAGVDAARAACDRDRRA